MSTRDFLLVTGTAGSLGFMLAGVFHRWALIVGLIFLAAQSYYLWYIYKPHEGGLLVGIFNTYYKRRVRTGFVMGIALVIFVVFAMEQGRQNVKALSEIIEIYEPHSSVEWVPRVSDDAIGRWILTTADPASTVLSYYQEIAARDGWQISSFSPPTFAVLRKEGIKVTFMAKDQDNTNTTVIITLSNVDD